MRTTILLLALSCPAVAQMAGYSSKELEKYTPLNPYPRLADGRPATPRFWLEMLRDVSSTEAHEALVEAGYPFQWEGGWKNPHPDKKLIGRALTVQFMPERPDVNRIIEADAAERGDDPHGTKRIIDRLQPGDVAVVDIMGKVKDGQFGGDNLIFGLFVASGNGFVVNGSFRDLEGVVPHRVPVFSRGYHPSIRAGAMLTGVNVPIRIGGVTIMPGDIVLGDRMGVTFIPPHLVQRVVAHVEGDGAAALLE